MIPDAFGVALGADVTPRWQLLHHLCQGHSLLPLEPARLLRRPLLTLARSAPLALRWGRLGRLRGWFLASLDGRRIARDVPDQMILHGVLEQRLVQPAR